MYSISYMYSTLFKLLTDTELHLRYAVIEWGNALSQIGCQAIILSSIPKLTYC